MSHEGQWAYPVREVLSNDMKEAARVLRVREHELQDAQKRHRQLEEKLQQKDDNISGLLDRVVFLETEVAKERISIQEADAKSRASDRTSSELIVVNTKLREELGRLNRDLSKVTTLPSSQATTETYKQDIEAAQYEQAMQLREVWHGILKLERVLEMDDDNDALANTIVGKWGWDESEATEIGIGLEGDRLMRGIPSTVWITARDGSGQGADLPQCAQIVVKASSEEQPNRLVLVGYGGLHLDGIRRVSPNTWSVRCTASEGRGQDRVGIRLLTSSGALMAARTLPVVGGTTSLDNTSAIRSSGLGEIMELERSGIMADREWSEPNLAHCDLHFSPDPVGPGGVVKATLSLRDYDGALLQAAPEGLQCAVRGGSGVTAGSLTAPKAQHGSVCFSFNASQDHGTARVAAVVSVEGGVSVSLEGSVAVRKIPMSSAVCEFPLKLRSIRGIIKSIMRSLRQNEQRLNAQENLIANLENSRPSQPVAEKMAFLEALVDEQREALSFSDAEISGLTASLEDAMREIHQNKELERGLKTKIDILERQLASSEWDRLDTAAQSNERLISALCVLPPTQQLNEILQEYAGIKRSAVNIHDAIPKEVEHLRDALNAAEERCRELMKELSGVSAADQLKELLSKVEGVSDSLVVSGENFKKLEEAMHPKEAPLELASVVQKLKESEQRIKQQDQELEDLRRQLDAQQPANLPLAQRIDNIRRRSTALESDMKNVLIDLPEPALEPEALTRARELVSFLNGHESIYNHPQHNSLFEEEQLKREIITLAEDSEAASSASLCKAEQATLESNERAGKMNASLVSTLEEAWRAHSEERDTDTQQKDNVFVMECLQREIVTLKEIAAFNYTLYQRQRDRPQSTAKTSELEEFVTTLKSERASYDTELHHFVKQLEGEKAALEAELHISKQLIEKNERATPFESDETTRSTAEIVRLRSLVESLEAEKAALEATNTKELTQLGSVEGESQKEKVPIPPPRIVVSGSFDDAARYATSDIMEEFKHTVETEGLSRAILKLQEANTRQDLMLSSGLNETSLQLYDGYRRRSVVLEADLEQARAKLADAGAMDEKVSAVLKESEQVMNARHAEEIAHVNATEELNRAILSLQEANTRQDLMLSSGLNETSLQLYDGYRRRSVVLEADLMEAKAKLVGTDVANEKMSAALKESVQLVSTKHAEEVHHINATEELSRAILDLQEANTRQDLMLSSGINETSLQLYDGYRRRSVVLEADLEQVKAKLAKAEQAEEVSDVVTSGVKLQHFTSAISVNETQRTLDRNAEAVKRLEHEKKELQQQLVELRRQCESHSSAEAEKAASEAVLSEKSGALRGNPREERTQHDLPTAQHSEISAHASTFVVPVAEPSIEKSDISIEQEALVERLRSENALLEKELAALQANTEQVCQLETCTLQPVEGKAISYPRGSEWVSGGEENPHEDSAEVAELHLFIKKLEAEKAILEVELKQSRKLIQNSLPTDADRGTREEAVHSDASISTVKASTVAELQGTHTHSGQPSVPPVTLFGGGEAMHQSTQEPLAAEVAGLRSLVEKLEAENAALEVVLERSQVSHDEPNSLLVNEESVQILEDDVHISTISTLQELVKRLQDEKAALVKDLEQAQGSSDVHLAVEEAGELRSFVEKPEVLQTQSTVVDDPALQELVRRLQDEKAALASELNEALSGSGVHLAVQTEHLVKKPETEKSEGSHDSLNNLVAKEEFVHIQNTAVNIPALQDLVRKLQDEKTALVKDLKEAQGGSSVSPAADEVVELRSLVKKLEAEKASTEANLLQQSEGSNNGSSDLVAKEEFVRTQQGTDNDVPALQEHVKRLQDEKASLVKDLEEAQSSSGVQLVIKTEQLVKKLETEKSEGSHDSLSILVAKEEFIQTQQSTFIDDTSLQELVKRLQDEKAALASELKAQSSSIHLAVHTEQLQRPDAPEGSHDSLNNLVAKEEFVQAQQSTVVNIPALQELVKRLQDEKAALVKDLEQAQGGSGVHLAVEEAGELRSFVEKPEVVQIQQSTVVDDPALQELVRRLQDEKAALVKDLKEAQGGSSVSPAAGEVVELRSLVEKLEAEKASIEANLQQSEGSKTNDLVAREEFVRTQQGTDNDVPALQELVKRLQDEKASLVKNLEEAQSSSGVNLAVEREQLVKKLETEKGHPHDSSSNLEVSRLRSLVERLKGEKTSLEATLERLNETNSLVSGEESIQAQQGTSDVFALRELVKKLAAELKAQGGDTQTPTVVVSDSSSCEDSTPAKEEAFLELMQLRRKSALLQAELEEALEERETVSASLVEAEGQITKLRRDAEEAAAQAVERQHVTALLGSAEEESLRREVLVLTEENEVISFKRVFAAQQKSLEQSEEAHKMSASLVSNLEATWRSRSDSERAAFESRKQDFLETEEQLRQGMATTQEKCCAAFEHVLSAVEVEEKLQRSVLTAEEDTLKQDLLVQSEVGSMVPGMTYLQLTGEQTIRSPVTGPVIEHNGGRIPVTPLLKQLKEHCKQYEDGISDVILKLQLSEAEREEALAALARAESLIDEQDERRKVQDICETAVSKAIEKVIVTPKDKKLAPTSSSAPPSISRRINFDGSDVSDDTALELLIMCESLSRELTVRSATATIDTVQMMLNLSEHEAVCRHVIAMESRVRMEGLLDFESQVESPWRSTITAGFESHVSEEVEELQTELSISRHKIDELSAELLALKANAVTSSFTFSDGDLNLRSARKNTLNVNVSTTDMELMRDVSLRSVVTDGMASSCSSTQWEKRAQRLEADLAAAEIKIEHLEEQLVCTHMSTPPSTSSHLQSPESVQLQSLKGEYSALKYRMELDQSELQDELLVLNDESRYARDLILLNLGEMEHRQSLQDESIDELYDCFRYFSASIPMLTQFLQRQLRMTERQLAMVRNSTEEEVTQLQNTLVTVETQHAKLLAAVSQHEHLTPMLEEVLVDDSPVQSMSLEEVTLLLQQSQRKVAKLEEELEALHGELELRTEEQEEASELVEFQGTFLTSTSLDVNVRHINEALSVVQKDTLTLLEHLSSDSPLRGSVATTEQLAILLASESNAFKRRRELWEHTEAIARHREQEEEELTRNNITAQCKSAEGVQNEGTSLGFGSYPSVSTLDNTVRETQSSPANASNTVLSELQKASAAIKQDLEEALSSGADLVPVMQKACALADLLRNLSEASLLEALGGTSGKQQQARVVKLEEENATLQVKLQATQLSSPTTDNSSWQVMPVLQKVGNQDDSATLKESSSTLNTSRQLEPNPKPEDVVMLRELQTMTQSAGTESSEVKALVRKLEAEKAALEAMLSEQSGAVRSAQDSEEVIELKALVKTLQAVGPTTAQHSEISAHASSAFVALKPGSSAEEEVDSAQLRVFVERLQSENALLETELAALKANTEQVCQLETEGKVISRGSEWVSGGEENPHEDSAEVAELHLFIKKLEAEKAILEVELKQSRKLIQNSLPTDADRGTREEAVHSDASISTVKASTVAELQGTHTHSGQPSVPPVTLFGGGEAMHQSTQEPLAAEVAGLRSLVEKLEAENAALEVVLERSQVSHDEPNSLLVNEESVQILEDDVHISTISTLQELVKRLQDEKAALVKDLEQAQGSSDVHLAVEEAGELRSFVEKPEVLQTQSTVVDDPALQELVRRLQDEKAALASELNEALSGSGVHLAVQTEHLVKKPETEKSEGSHDSLNNLVAKEEFVHIQNTAVNIPALQDLVRKLQDEKTALVKDLKEAQGGSSVSPAADEVVELRSLVKKLEAEKASTEANLLQQSEGSNNGSSDLVAKEAFVQGTVIDVPPEGQLQDEKALASELNEALSGSGVHLAVQTEQLVKKLETEKSEGSHDSLSILVAKEEFVQTQQSTVVNIPALQELVRRLQDEKAALVKDLKEAQGGSSVSPAADEVVELRSLVEKLEAEKASTEANLLQQSEGSNNGSSDLVAREEFVRTQQGTDNSDVFALRQLVKKLQNEKSALAAELKEARGGDAQPPAIVVSDSSSCEDSTTPAKEEAFLELVKLRRKSISLQAELEEALEERETVSASLVEAEGQINTLRRDAEEAAAQAVERQHVAALVRMEEEESLRREVLVLTEENEVISFKRVFAAQQKALKQTVEARKMSNSLVSNLEATWKARADNNKPKSEKPRSAKEACSNQLAELRTVAAKLEQKNNALLAQPSGIPVSISDSVGALIKELREAGDDIEQSLLTTSDDTVIPALQKAHMLVDLLKALPGSGERDEEDIDTDADDSTAKPERTSLQTALSHHSQSLLGTTGHDDSSGLVGEESIQTQQGTSDVFALRQLVKKLQNEKSALTSELKEARGGGAQPPAIVVSDSSSCDSTTSAKEEAFLELVKLRRKSISLQAELEEALEERETVSASLVEAEGQINTLRRDAEEAAAQAVERQHVAALVRMEEEESLRREVLVLTEENEVISFKRVFAAQQKALKQTVEARRLSAYWINKNEGKPSQRPGSEKAKEKPLDAKEACSKQLASIRAAAAKLEQKNKTLLPEVSGSISDSVGSLIKELREAGDDIEQSLLTTSDNSVIPALQKAHMLVDLLKALPGSGERDEEETATEDTENAFEAAGKETRQQSAISVPALQALVETLQNEKATLAAELKEARQPQMRDDHDEDSPAKEQEPFEVVQLRRKSALLQVELEEAEGQIDTLRRDAEEAAAQAVEMQHVAALKRVGEEESLRREVLILLQENEVIGFKRVFAAQQKSLEQSEEAHKMSASLVSNLEATWKARKDNEEAEKSKVSLERRIDGMMKQMSSKEKGYDTILGKAEELLDLMKSEEQTNTIREELKKDSHETAMSRVVGEEDLRRHILVLSAEGEFEMMIQNWEIKLSVVRHADEPQSPERTSVENLLVKLQRLEEESVFNGEDVGRAASIDMEEAERAGVVKLFFNGIRSIEVIAEARRMGASIVSTLDADWKSRTDSERDVTASRLHANTAQNTRLQSALTTLTTNNLFQANEQEADSRAYILSHEAVAWKVLTNTLHHGTLEQALKRNFALLETESSETADRLALQHDFSSQYEDAALSFLGISNVPTAVLTCISANNGRDTAVLNAVRQKEKHLRSVLAVTEEKEWLECLLYGFFPMHGAGPSEHLLAALGHESAHNSFQKQLSSLEACEASSRRLVYQNHEAALVEAVLEMMSGCKDPLQSVQAFLRDEAARHHTVEDLTTARGQICSGMVVQEAAARHFITTEERVAWLESAVAHLDDGKHCTGRSEQVDAVHSVLQHLAHCEKQTVERVAEEEEAARKLVEQCEECDWLRQLVSTVCPSASETATQQALDKLQQEGRISNAMQDQSTTSVMQQEDLMREALVLSEELDWHRNMCEYLCTLGSGPTISALKTLELRAAYDHQARVSTVRAEQEARDLLAMEERNMWLSSVVGLLNGREQGRGDMFEITVTAADDVMQQLTESVEGKHAMNLLAVEQLMQEEEAARELLMQCEETAWVMGAVAQMTRDLSLAEDKDSLLAIVATLQCVDDDKQAISLLQDQLHEANANTVLQSEAAARDLLVSEEHNVWLDGVVGMLQGSGTTNEEILPGLSAVDKVFNKLAEGVENKCASEKQAVERLEKEEETMRNLLEQCEETAWVMGAVEQLQQDTSLPAALHAVVATLQCVDDDKQAIALLQTELDEMKIDTVLQSEATASRQAVERLEEEEKTTRNLLEQCEETAWVMGAVAQLTQDTLASTPGPLGAVVATLQCADDDKQAIALLQTELDEANADVVLQSEAVARELLMSEEHIAWLDGIVGMLQGSRNADEELVAGHSATSMMFSKLAEGVNSRHASEKQAVERVIEEEEAARKLVEQCEECDWLRQLVSTVCPSASETATQQALDKLQEEETATGAMQDQSIALIMQQERYSRDGIMQGEMLALNETMCSYLAGDACAHDGDPVHFNPVRVTLNTLEHTIAMQTSYNNAMLANVVKEEEAARKFLVTEEQGVWYAQLTVPETDDMGADKLLAVNSALRQLAEGVSCRHNANEAAIAQLLQEEKITRKLLMKCEEIFWVTGAVEQMQLEEDSSTIGTMDKVIAAVRRMDDLQRELNTTNAEKVFSAEEAERKLLVADEQSTWLAGVMNMLSDGTGEDTAVRTALHKLSEGIDTRETINQQAVERVVEEEEAARKLVEQCEECDWLRQLVSTVCPSASETATQQALDKLLDEEAATSAMQDQSTTSVMQQEKHSRENIMQSEQLAWCMAACEYLAAESCTPGTDPKTATLKSLEQRLALRAMYNNAVLANVVKEEEAARDLLAMEERNMWLSSVVGLLNGREQGRGDMFEITVTAADDVMQQLTESVEGKHAMNLLAVEQLTQEEEAARELLMQCEETAWVMGAVAQMTRDLSLAEDKDSLLAIVATLQCVDDDKQAISLLQDQLHEANANTVLQSEAAARDLLVSEEHNVWLDGVVGMLQNPGTSGEGKFSAACGVFVQLSESVDRRQTIDQRAVDQVMQEEEAARCLLWQCEETAWVMGAVAQMTQDTSASTPGPLGAVVATLQCADDDKRAISLLQAQVVDIVLQGEAVARKLVVSEEHSAWLSNVVGMLHQGHGCPSDDPSTASKVFNKLAEGIASNYRAVEQLVDHERTTRDLLLQEQETAWVMGAVEQLQQDTSLPAALHAVVATLQCVDDDKQAIALLQTELDEMKIDTVLQSEATASRQAVERLEEEEKTTRNLLEQCEETAWVMGAVAQLTQDTLASTPGPLGAVVATLQCADDDKKAFSLLQTELDEANVDIMLQGEAATRELIISEEHSIWLSGVVNMLQDSGDDQDAASEVISKLAECVENRQVINQQAVERVVEEEEAARKLVEQCEECDWLRQLVSTVCPSASETATQQALDKLQEEETATGAMQDQSTASIMQQERYSRDGITQGEMLAWCSNVHEYLAAESSSNKDPTSAVLMTIAQKTKLRAMYNNAVLANVVKEEEAARDLLAMEERNMWLSSVVGLLNGREQGRGDMFEITVTAADDVMQQLTESVEGKHAMNLLAVEQLMQEEEAARELLMQCEETAWVMGAVAQMTRDLSLAEDKDSLLAIVATLQCVDDDKQAISLLQDQLHEANANTVLQSEAAARDLLVSEEHNVWLDGVIGHLGSTDAPSNVLRSLHEATEMSNTVAQLQVVGLVQEQEAAYREMRLEEERFRVGISLEAAVHRAMLTETQIMLMLEQDAAKQVETEEQCERKALWWWIQLKQLETTTRKLNRDMVTEEQEKEYYKLRWEESTIFGNNLTGGERDVLRKAVRANNAIMEGFRMIAVEEDETHKRETLTADEARSAIQLELAYNTTKLQIVIKQKTIREEALGREVIRLAQEISYGVYAKRRNALLSSPELMKLRSSLMVAFLQSEEIDRENILFEEENERLLVQAARQKFDIDKYTLMYSSCKSALDACKRKRTEDKDYIEQLEYEVKMARKQYAITYNDEGIQSAGTLVPLHQKKGIADIDQAKATRDMFHDEEQERWTLEMTWWQSHMSISTMAAQNLVSASKKGKRSPRHGKRWLMCNDPTPHTHSVTPPVRVFNNTRSPSTARRFSSGGGTSAASPGSISISPRRPAGSASPALSPSLMPSLMPSTSRSRSRSPKTVPVAHRHWVPAPGRTSPAPQPQSPASKPAIPPLNLR